MRDPRHILITGASSGLGAALSHLYAGPGICLSLHGRDEDRLNDVAKATRERGSEVSTHLGSVTHAADLARWVEERHNDKPLDLLIANAGVSAGTFGGGESFEQAQATLDINVQGVFNTVQPAVPLMQKRKKGQIALMSSLAGFRGMPGAPTYCASKAAVRIYGEGLRTEMAKSNVEINVICPGFIKTPMTDVNRFRMPFLMSAEKAALIIRKDLAANKARIAFPRQFYALVWLLTTLPQPAAEFFSSRTPKK